MLVPIPIPVMISIFFLLMDPPTSTVSGPLQRLLFPLTQVQDSVIKDYTSGTYSCSLLKMTAVSSPKLQGVLQLLLSACVYAKAFCNASTATTML